MFVGKLSQDKTAKKYNLQEVNFAQNSFRPKYHDSAIKAGLACRVSTHLADHMSKSDKQGGALKILDFSDDTFRILLLLSRRSLLLSTVSNATRKKIQESVMVLNINITTTAMTEDVLQDFDRLATLFQIRIQGGVKLQDIFFSPLKPSNMLVQGKFLACIHSMKLSKIHEIAEAVTKLAAVLPKCTSLARLDLFCNIIGAEGAGSLAAALPQCPSLAHLNLRFKSIGAEGAGAWRRRCRNAHHLLT